MRAMTHDLLAGLRAYRAELVSQLTAVEALLPREEPSKEDPEPDPQPPQRGARRLTEAQKKAISRRMRAYWKTRRQK